MPRTLVAKENPKLIEPVRSTRPARSASRRPTPARVYTVGDKDAPHLIGRVIVVNTQFVAYPDSSGHFEIDNIPPGAYKLKIWYRDNWLQRPDDDRRRHREGQDVFNPKVAAAAFAPAPAK